MDPKLAASPSTYPSYDYPSSPSPSSGSSSSSSSFMPVWSDDLDVEKILGIEFPLDGGNKDTINNSNNTTPSSSHHHSSNPLAGLLNCILSFFSSS